MSFLITAVLIALLCLCAAGLVHLAMVLLDSFALEDEGLG